MRDQLVRINGRHPVGHHPIAAPGASTAVPLSGRPGAQPSRGPFAILRYLDVVLVLLAAAPALALGAPVLGYAVGAGAWILQRVLAQLDRRWVGKAAEPRTQLGFNLFEAFGRIWLLAGAIVIAGVAGGRADGLTAAVVIFCAYSVAFVIRVFSGPPGGPGSSRTQREAVR
jgi:hypothetical protein